MLRRIASRVRKLLCAAPKADEKKNLMKTKKRFVDGSFPCPAATLIFRLLGCIHRQSEMAVDGKFAPLDNKTHFIVGQDLDTVRDFVKEVLPNPSGTTSYTCISKNTNYSLHGLDHPVDYGAGTIDAKAQMTLVPGSVLVLGVCIKGALEDIVMRRCDASIDRFGDWIRSQPVPVFLRIGYEFDGPWNDYDSEYYKLAFKWIVSRLRFKGVQNFVSVWQSATYTAYIDNGCRSWKIVDRSFIDWYPGDDVVDWMGTSYFDFDKRIHDAFLNFARSRKKPLMIAESAPQGYDLELGERLDHFTNERISSGLSGRMLWENWYEPFFKYVRDNQDIIRAVAYINTPWKTQKLWATGDNGFWGDSRIQVIILTFTVEIVGFLGKRLHKGKISEGIVG